MDVRILAISALCLGIVVACSDQRKPPGLLSKDQMVETMTELYLAEQRASTIGVSRDSTSQILKEM